jgi:hypothetical protein
MKAKDWVARFDTDKQEEFFKAYAEETAKLIDERTKNSGIYVKGDKAVNTRPDAIVGALREQRQKWNAICQKTNGSLTTRMFDTQILGLCAPYLVVTQQEPPEEATNTDISPGKIGRKLVKN